MILGKSLSSAYSAVFVVLLATSATAEADNEGWPVDAAIKDGDCFDYVIIGSGVGAVVANRLTEDASVSVLLIEAGPVPSNASRYPGNFATLQNSYLDWQYKSEPELTTQSQSGNAFKLASGLTLGGSSQIDHMIWFRGDPHDFNLWCYMIDDPSWCYDYVLPYFLKSEAMKDQEILADLSTYHNTTGPIDITRETYPVADLYLKSFNETGHEVKLELNGRNTLGYTQPTFHINGIKQSTSEKYLKPIVNRTNLYVSYKTVATKIHFVDNIAVSVNVIIDGKTITVKAGIEIILSAGVYNSPKLLMLSGIGPKEHLESFNITVLKDLPVGQNLKDHVTVLLITKMNETSAATETPPVTKIGIPAFIGQLKLNDNVTYPQGQTTNLILPSAMITAVCTNLFGYTKDICERLANNSSGRDVLFTLAAVVDPSSTGNVTLKSTDPLAQPVIKLGYYSVSSDLDKMVELIQDFYKVLNTTFFQSAKAAPVNLSFEGCEGDFSSEEYIKCYSQRMSTTMFHQSGTCSMGTVLDSKLKVKGVAGLRVVDASIMPHVPTTNCLAAAIMIAEKASDMIKAEQDKNSVCG